MEVIGKKLLNPFCACFDDFDDKKIVNYCIEGFVNVIKMAGVFGINDDRDKFMEAFCRLTGFLNPANNNNINNTNNGAS